MQIPPPPQLSHLVRHFLILESPGSERTIHRLIPDGNPGIVLHFGTPFQPFPKSFVYGQVTRPHSIVSNGNIGALIVVLRPQALQLITGLPPATLRDNVISLQTKVLEDQLLEAPDHWTRIDHIQSFLLQYATWQPNPIIDYSIQWIEDHEAPNIEKLAAKLPISRRTLERIFQTAIGISPKQFAGIVRTQHFLKALSQTNKENITTLAYEFGYYDQSHLIRDFKTKTGITPGKYFAAKNALALNFIQFPA